MKTLYINPAYPIESNSRIFSEPLKMSSDINFHQLDETKTVTDILEIYFYNNISNDNNAPKPTTKEKIK